MLLNKIDLLPHVDFDMAKCVEYARRVNPNIRVIELSATKGQGMADWLAWISKGVEDARCAPQDSIGTLKAQVVARRRDPRFADQADTTLAARRAIRVRGVQGVGFRPFVWRLANELQLNGFVRNDAQGVAIEIEGESDARLLYRSVDGRGAGAGAHRFG